VFRITRFQAKLAERAKQADNSELSANLLELILKAQQKDSEIKAKALKLSLF
jgi:hypothetical protein